MISSLSPLMFVPTTGTPMLMASREDTGMPSLWEGRTKVSVMLRRFAMSFLYPVKMMSFFSPFVWMVCLMMSFVFLSRSLCRVSPIMRSLMSVLCFFRRENASMSSMMPFSSTSLPMNVMILSVWLRFSSILRVCLSSLLNNVGLNLVVVLMPTLLMLMILSVWMKLLARAKSMSSWLTVKM